MKVGDLIRVDDYLGGPSSTGLVCKIENAPGERGQDTIKYWTMWTDGEFAWISEEDDPEVINEGR